MMSFTCMAWASTQKTGSSTKKLILLMLADRANESGLCYPSQQRLADDCEMSRSAVSRNIKELESAGLLTIKHRSKDGVKLPNHYVLQIEGVVAESYKGSSTEPHKPIKEPISTKFTSEIFSLEELEQVIAYRKSIKSPLKTQQGITLLSNKFKECYEHGYTFADLFNLMCGKEWKSLELEWVVKSITPSNAKKEFFYE